MHVFEPYAAETPLFEEADSDNSANQETESGTTGQTTPDAELFDRLREHLADRDDWIDQQCDTGRMSPIAARLEAAMEVVAGTRAEVGWILRAFDEHEMAKYRQAVSSRESARASRSVANDVLESRGVQDRLYDDFESQYALVAEEVKSGSAPRDVVFYSSASGQLEEYRVAWAVAKSVQISSDRRNRANALFRIAYPTWRHQ